MKVLQVLPHLNIGGITTYVYTLTKYLLDQNIQVAICSSGGSQEEQFKKIGAKIYRIPIKTKNELSPKVLISALKLCLIQKKFNYDLIHSHTRVTQVTAQLTSQLSNKPHIANFHGFYQKNKKRKLRKIIKAQGRASIAITSLVRDDLIKFFRADPKKVKTILSGIDLKTLNKDASPLQLKGTPTIGASGRFSQIKGFQYLIQSIPQIIKIYPQAQIYLLGQGKYKTELINLAKKIGVTQHLSLLEKKSLSSFLNSLDVFCLPSLEEPLGLSVLEAQYLGVPVVASGVDGLKILVKDQETGLRVPPADASSIGQAIIRLISDRELYQKITKNAQEQVVKNFDISNKINAFIEIYEEATRKNSSG